MDARGEVLQADWRPELGTGVSVVLYHRLFSVYSHVSWNPLFLYKALLLFVCDKSVYSSYSNCPFCKLKNSA